MMIWVVMGTTGEYSDRSEWPVKAFRDERQAERFAMAAKIRASEIEATRKALGESGEWNNAADQALLKTNELDPDMKTVYTGTDYYAMGPIELEEIIE